MWSNDISNQDYFGKFNTVSNGRRPCHRMDSLGHVGPNISQHSFTFPETKEWVVEKEKESGFRFVPICHLNWLAVFVFYLFVTDHHSFSSLKQVYLLYYSSSG